MNHSCRNCSMLKAGCPISKTSALDTENGCFQYVCLGEPAIYMDEACQRAGERIAEGFPPHSTDEEIDAIIKSQKTRFDRWVFEPIMMGCLWFFLGGGFFVILLIILIAILVNHLIS